MACFSFFRPYFLRQKLGNAARRGSSFNPPAGNTFFFLSTSALLRFNQPRIFSIAPPSLLPHRANLPPGVTDTERPRLSQTLLCTGVTPHLFLCRLAQLGQSFPSSSETSRGAGRLAGRPAGIVGKRKEKKKRKRKDEFSSPEELARLRNSQSLRNLCRGSRLAPSFLAPPAFIDS